MIKFFIPFLFVSVQMVHASESNIPTSDPYSVFNVARTYLPIYIDDCLTDSVHCPLNPQEKEWLLGILANLPSEPALQYISVKKEPDHFTGIGIHRNAETGLKRGDVIYVNTDEIGNVDYFSAIAILTHEFGHHQGVPDTNDRSLDVLGSKVQNFFSNKAQVSTLKEYNQPNVKLLAYTPGKITNEIPNSQVLLMDQLGVTDIGSNLIDNRIPCALNTKRVGGIQVAQPISTGPFDWDNQTQTQDFGFTLSAQQRCIGSGSSNLNVETRILMKIYLDIQFEPESGINEKNWYQKGPGKIVPGTDMDVVQNGIIDEQNYSSHYGEPLKVISIDSPHQLTNGSNLNVTATVEIPLNVAIESCAGLMTSTDFVNYGFKRRFKFPFKECKLTSLSASQFKLELSYDFPSSTPSREYIIDSLSLKIKGQELQFSGQPTFLQKFTLTSSSLPTPLALKKVSLTKIGADGKPMFDKEAIDWTQSQLFHISATQLFGFQLTIDSSNPLLPEAFLTTSFDWSYQGEERMYDGKDIHFSNSAEEKSWKMPFNGSSQIVPYPGQPGRYVFQMSVRPKSSSGSAFGNVLKRMSFPQLWMINKNLQELYLEMDTTLQADLP